MELKVKFQESRQAINVELFQDVTVLSLPQLSSAGAAGDLLEGKQLIDGEGKVVDGTMPAVAPETVVLDASNLKYAILPGKHDGTGIVKINPQMMEFTPTKEGQVYDCPPGFVLSTALIYPIPDKYQDVTPVTAGVADVVAGKTIVDAKGNVVEGAADLQAAAREIVSGTITNYSDNKLVNIAPYGFYRKTYLDSVKLPNVLAVDVNGFSGCTALTSVHLPKVRLLENGAFSGCTALPILDLPDVRSIANNAFYNCRALAVLILRHPYVVSLGGVQAITGSYFATTGGKVYVPRAQISSYQNATNWSTLYSGGAVEFVAIEGSEYE